MSTQDPYTPDQIVVKVVDVVAEARSRWGDRADYIAGRSLPEREYRIEIIAGTGERATRIILPAGEWVSAERILAIVNRT